MEKILDYKLGDLLGKGSFSEVYVGEKGGQKVAIKLMKPPQKINAEELLASLRYEFWVLKDLAHENIVHLFDFGQTPDGRLYLVEEFIDGVPLNIFCEKNPFRDCEKIFIGLLYGLSELMRWQLIHGDIKPANILVTQGPEGPLAKILDFGMAHTDVGSYQSSIFWGGTPSTMAPEIILRHPSDHRADLYSLGVTFYACLAGKNPFLGENVDATCQNHLHKKEEPIGLTRHDVPPEWAELIHQLMEKNPDDRPYSPLKALSLIKKETFILNPTSFVGRSHELAEAMALEDSLISRKKKALVVEGKKGMGVTRFLREVFFQLISRHPELRDRIALVGGPPFPDKPILLIEGLRAPKNYNTVSIHLQPLSRNETSQWLSLIFNVKGIPENFLEKIHSLCRGHPQSIWDLLTVLSDKGLLSDAAGQVTPSTLALADWNRVLPEGEMAGGLDEDFDWVLEKTRRRVQGRQVLGDDPVWDKLEKLAGLGKDSSLKLIGKAQTLALKGEAAIDENKLEGAREMLTTALEIFRNSPQHKIDAIRVNNFLAYILLRQGKTAEAITHFEASLDEVHKNLKPEEIRQITNLDLGLAYLHAGLFEKAVERLKEELQFHRSLKSDPLFRQIALAHEIGCLYNLAQSLTSLGKTEMAEKYYQEVIEGARRRQDPAFILRGLNGLGNLLRSTNRWREAKKAYDEALELALALKDLASAAAAGQNRGGLAASHGLYPEAIRDLTESLKWLERIKTPYAFEKKLICRSHLERGEIYLTLHRLTEAQEDFDRAWHLAEKDADLADFRFWVLLARCRLWKTRGEREGFKQDLARLHFYADTEEKKKKLADLEFSEKQTVLPKPSAAPQAIGYESLLEITGDLLDESTLEELLKKILSHAIRLSQAELGVILLADEPGGLKPVLSLNALLNEELSEISLSVARDVLASGKVVCAQDALQEAPYSQATSVMALNLRSIIGLPIAFRGKILGVLYLSHRWRPALFDENIAKILSAFAGQAGLALTNHRLLEFHRQAKEQTAAELEDTRSELILTKEKIRNLPEKFRNRVFEGPIKTRSRVVMEIMDQVERAAQTSLSLVIYGETGTGKEMMARFAHDISPRRNQPFVAINCGALPHTLIESELFGHAKGAFTGADRDKMGLIEAAHGGDLFLDEMADLPPEAQVKLLRVLQEREVLRLGETKPRPVDIRLMAASQKQLRDAVIAGKFREDLFFRLMGLEVVLPPLRERPEDIPLLTSLFLGEFLKDQHKKEPEKIAASLLRLMISCPWPGNIRELKNMVITGAALSEGKVLTLESLPKNLQDQLISPRKKGIMKSGTQTSGAGPGWYRPGQSWEDHLLMIYASSLSAMDFNVARVAASLGVGVATVYKWMRENRIRELRDEWSKKVLPYPDGLKLDQIRSEIFSEAGKRFPGHPYHAARELDVAPVTFYRWSR